MTSEKVNLVSLLVELKNMQEFLFTYLGLWNKGAVINYWGGGGRSVLF